MKGRIPRLGQALAMLLLSVSPSGSSMVSAAAGSRSGSIACSPDGKLLLVANPDSDSVSILTLPALEVVAEIPAGKNPQSVAFHPSAPFAYVTARDDGTISIIGLEGRRRIATVSVGGEPSGVVVGADGSVYVSDSESGSVLALAGGSLETRGKIATESQPRALALSADGKSLFATHLRTGRLTVVNTAALRVESVIQTLPDANLSLGIFLDNANGLAYLPQTRSNSSNPALLFDTTVFPIVSVVDLGERANAPGKRISIEIADRPVSIPADALRDANGRLYVVNSGSSDVSVIDLGHGIAVAHIEVGEHPTGIALAPDGGALYVNDTLSGTVSVIDPGVLRVVREVTVTRIPLPRNILRGKILFNSSNRPQMAREHWISCASCHFEGEMDGRTWNFPDGPRNTPSLLGVRDTKPFHWAGDLDELQDVETTIRRIQAGAGLAPGDDNCQPACDLGPPNSGRSEDLDALAAFMASLELRPSPILTAARKLTEAAERGRRLFEAETTGCASCHPAPLYTDRRKHDVGTGSSPSERKGSSFDTPSLRGVYKTAPYLHDGSAATLMDVLATSNAGDLHGRTSQLTPGDVSDLVEFLRALPFDLAQSACTNEPCPNRSEGPRPLPRKIPPR